MELTGERIIPELMKPTNGMLLEHIARYYFATPYATGRVLDIACGVGYGTHMIGRTRRLEVDEVIGVDIDEASIAYAKGHYYHPRVKYEIFDATSPDLGAQLGRFDCIVSFETIEHLPDDKAFVSSLFQILKPGGMLIISTPFGQGRGKPTSEKFHVHQLTDEEFQELFTSFADVEVYYQRGVTIEPRRAGVRYPIGVAVCRKSL